MLVDGEPVGTVDSDEPLTAERAERTDVVDEREGVEGGRRSRFGLRR